MVGLGEMAHREKESKGESLKFVKWRVRAGACGVLGKGEEVVCGRI